MWCAAAGVPGGSACAAEFSSAAGCSERTPAGNGALVSELGSFLSSAVPEFNPFRDGPACCAASCPAPVVVLTTEGPEEERCAGCDERTGSACAGCSRSRVTSRAPNAMSSTDRFGEEASDSGGGLCTVWSAASLESSVPVTRGVGWGACDSVTAERAAGTMAAVSETSTWSFGRAFRGMSDTNACGVSGKAAIFATGTNATGAEVRAVCDGTSSPFEGAGAGIPAACGASGFRAGPEADAAGAGWCPLRSTLPLLPGAANVAQESAAGDVAVGRWAFPKLAVRTPVDKGMADVGPEAAPLAAFGFGPSDES